ncbi:SMP-30/Gluconolaconase/LRE-like region-domain-containing protein [Xylaria palmicola]|nr:SMP-30/Gluconolaconase/LRE-like region-domain-containing protein [Xylaria palmicola]
MNKSIFCGLGPNIDGLKWHDIYLTSSTAPLYKKSQAGEPISWQQDSKEIACPPDHCYRCCRREDNERPWRYTIHLNEPVTRLDVIEGRSDYLAAQTRLGLALLNSTSGAIERLRAIGHADDTDLDDRVRTNDGGIDARGRWWASTTALDEESRIGRLWRFDGDEVRDVGAHDERAAVINGIVWSPDDKVMYTCDTPEGAIYQYDYDVESGTATNRQLFAKLEDGGMPDGLAVDVEGHVWAAANSQGKLARLEPQGEVTATCMIPGAKMASCPAFGDKDMKTLFITSITAEGSTGDVYRARVDVPGIQRHPIKI